LKLSAASCGESLILIGTMPFVFTRLSRGKSRGMRSLRIQQMKKFLIYFCVILICLSLGLVSDGQKEIKLDVPYEPSSDEVVGAMIKIAKAKLF